MSRSPLEADALAADGTRSSYELGWVAIHRLMREGSSWSGRERDVAYLNAGDGTFFEVGALIGFDSAGDGRGLAVTDWDGDGDLDLWTVERTAPRARLLRNDAPGSGEEGGARRLQFELVGSGANRDAIGARVEVTFEGRTRRRALRAGEGYLSQSTKVLHFGLGRASGSERDERAGGPIGVVVHWPAGAAESFEGVTEPGRWRLVRGAGTALRVRPAAGPAAALTGGSLEVSAPSAVGRVVLAAPVPLPIFQYEDAAGEPTQLLHPSGPLLVTLWASWCAPCAVELRDLAESAEALATRGLQVLALSIDEGGAREEATRLLGDLAWPFASGWASPALVEHLDVLQQSVVERRRRLPVPTSFLLDPSGAVVAIYRGRLTSEQLSADLGALVSVDPAERKSVAAPFAGRWRGDWQPVPDWAALEFRMRERGLENAAAFYQRMSFESLESSPAKVHYEIGVVRAQQGQPERAVASFREALRLRPDYLEAQKGLAYVLQSIADYSEAAELWEAVLRRTPEDPVSWYNASLTQAALGHGEAALRRLEKLQELDPESARQLAAQLDLLQRR